MPGHAFVTINDDQLSIIGPDENTLLLVNDREDEEKKPAGKLYTLYFKIFYILCFLTGQLPIRPAKSDTNRGWRLLCLGGVVLSMALVALSLLVNVIFALGFNFYVIILCPYKDCGYISTTVTLMTAILNLTDAMNVTNNSGLQVVQPTKLVIFNDWQKTVVTTATLSGTISFLFMVYVLYSQYSVCRDTFCKCCKSCMNSLWTYFGEEPREKSEGVLLSPFKDDTSSGDTKLAPKQATYFMTIFIFNLLVYGIDVALLFSIFAESVNKNLKIPEIVNGFGLASQFASQFCAILSCFIFSKLAYSVWNTCVHKLPDLYKEIEISTEIHQFQRNNLPRLQEGEHVVPQEADANEQNPTDYVIDDHLHSLFSKQVIDVNDISKLSRLHLLKAVANWYSRMLHTTLHPFGTWFAVHWVLFTVAAFMSISYLAETIILELYGSEQPDKECHGERTMHCRLRLAYVFFFAVEHCILFLYPCFRAASVTSAYTSMIKKVSKAEWNNNISLDDKEKFISYLKIQDCTFKISILCAKLSFGFYIAYFSIFVGVFGVILKLAL